MFFIFNIALAMWVLLKFHFNLKIRFPVSEKNKDERNYDQDYIEGVNHFMWCCHINNTEFPIREQDLGLPQVFQQCFIVFSVQVFQLTG